MFWASMCCQPDNACHVNVEVRVTLFCSTRAFVAAGWGTTKSLHEAVCHTGS